MYKRQAFLMLDISDPTAAQAEINRRQERLEAAEAELASLNLPDTGDIALLAEGWTDLEVADKRELLSAAIDAVFLRRAPDRGTWPIEDRVHICWHGEGPDDLPGVGRRLMEMKPYEW